MRSDPVCGSASVESYARSFSSRTYAMRLYCVRERLPRKFSLASSGRMAALLILLPFLGSPLNAARPSAPPPSSEASVAGIIQVPAFAMPLSSYMSEEAKQTFIQRPPFAGLRSESRPNLTLQDARRIVDAWYRPQVER